MPEGWKVEEEAPSGWKAEDTGWKVEGESEWKDTPYGFKTRKIEVSNPQTGKPMQVEQRDVDMATYWGKPEGNKGMAGWFSPEGMRQPDTMQPPPAWATNPIARMKYDVNQANVAYLNEATARQQYAQQHPIASLVPPFLRGATQATIDFPTKVAQLVAHKGFGSNVVDPYANALEQNYQETMGGSLNEPQQSFGRLVGSTPLYAELPINPLAGKVREALTKIGLGRAAAPVANVATGAASGAVLAPTARPEVGVTSEEDFNRRVAEEAAAGAKFGGGIPAVAEAAAAAAPMISAGAKALKAPSPGAYLEELAGRFRGAPGEALKESAIAKYDAAWDKFKQAVAPVDEQAGSIGMDYSPAISKIESLLGVGQKRPPAPLNSETEKSLDTLLERLKVAMDGGVTKDGRGVDNSFAGAIDTIKWLGAEGRRLAEKHGDVKARELLGDVKDSILDAMTQSSPMLSEQARNARNVFAENVVPLFDKKFGGHWLEQIRESPNPADILVKGHQGQLTRVLPQKTAIIAQGSSADPILYSYLDAAIAQSKGNPNAFADSIAKAMPAVEAIADPKTLEAFKGMQKVAQASNIMGRLANVGVGAMAPGMGGAGAVVGALSPARFSGPALVWQAVRTPPTQKLLSYASKLPEGSKEFQLIANDIYKSIVPATQQAPQENK